MTKGFFFAKLLKVDIILNGSGDNFQQIISYFEFFTQ